MNRLDPAKKATSMNITATTLRQASLYVRMPVIARLRQASMNPSLSKLARTTYRLAARWVMARSGNPGEDLMARLQVLEGVAGVSPWTWSRNPRNGVKEAQAHFEGTAIDPSWFSKGDTGMVGLVWGSVDSFFRKQRQEMAFTADDIIQNGLMGLALDGTKYTKGPLFYQVGAYNSAIHNKLPKGNETPRSVGGTAKNIFVQKGVNQLKKLQKNRSTMNLDDGGNADIEWDGLNNRSRLKVFLDIVSDKNDPLGVKLQGIIRSEWAGTRAGPPLDAWLDAVIDRGMDSDVNQSAIAKQFGIAGGTLQRNLKKYMGKAIAKITADKRIQAEISERIDRDQMRLASLVRRVAKARGISAGTKMDAAGAARALKRLSDQSSPSEITEAIADALMWMGDLANDAGNPMNLARQMVKLQDQFRYVEASRTAGTKRDRDRTVVRTLNQMKGVLARVFPAFSQFKVHSIGPPIGGHQQWGAGGGQSGKGLIDNPFGDFESAQAALNKVSRDFKMIEMQPGKYVIWKRDVDPGPESDDVFHYKIILDVSWSYIPEGKLLLRIHGDSSFKESLERYRSYA